MINDKYRFVTTRSPSLSSGADRIFTSPSAVLTAVYWIHAKMEYKRTFSNSGKRRYDRPASDRAPWPSQKILEKNINIAELNCRIVFRLMPN